MTLGKTPGLPGAPFSHPQWHPPPGLGEHEQAQRTQSVHRCLSLVSCSRDQGQTGRRPSTRRWPPGRSQSGSPGRSPPHPAPYPWPCAPSLEPLAAAVAEAEADPADVRPMGLECFPPRPGGFRPLGFCMVVPLSGWERARAGHVLPAIVTHLPVENKSDHIITSP